MSFDEYVFIIGPRKTGTSTLFRWIADNGNVSTPYKKETHYFVDPENPFHDADHNYKCHGWSGFNSMYECSADIVVEASTHYFYQNTAKEAIPQVSSKVVVVCLRDPVNRLVSCFNYAKYVQGQVVTWYGVDEFLRDAIREDWSSIHQHVKSRKHSYELSHEPQFSKYHKWHPEWLNLVESDLLTIPLRALSSAPSVVMQAVSNNLGCDVDFGRVDVVERHNQFRKARWPTLQRLVRYRLAPMVPDSLASAVKSLYRSVMYVQDGQKETPSPDTRADADKKYEDARAYLRTVENAWEEYSSEL